MDITVYLTIMLAKFINNQAKQNLNNQAKQNLSDFKQHMQ